MEFLVELVLELVGEFGLTLLGEALGATLPGNWKDKPVLASLGYVLLGAVGAGVSLLIWPHALISDRGLRALNFVASPILCAMMMFAVGAIHVRRGRERLATTGARHGLLLGLSYQLIRTLAAS